MRQLVRIVWPGIHQCTLRQVCSLSGSCHLVCTQLVKLLRAVYSSIWQRSKWFY